MINILLLLVLLVGILGLYIQTCGDYNRNIEIQDRKYKDVKRYYDRRW